jgi:hypothetical protein
MPVLGAVRQITEAFIQRRTQRQLKALTLVNQPLQGGLQTATHSS